MSNENVLDLAYLAGLMDGEGYIGISRNDRKRGSTQYYPRITLVNTNKRLIDEVVRILNNNAIPYHLVHWETNKAEHKSRWTIEMIGFRRALKFLWIVEPSMRIKRPQAQFLMAFLWSRLRHGKSYQHTSYTDEEVNLYDALKELNAKGSVILREHTPDAVHFAAKMCSELRAKGAEATEMMARLDRSEGWVRSK